MLKNISRLEFNIGEKTYHFLCDIDAPIDHAKIALNEFSNYLVKLEASIREQQAESNQQDNLEVIDGEHQ